ncbi:MAG TPA: hypothetical protein VH302_02630 [Bryobacteraceae bacterium]|nr:hypothetical protein [Bryobacteraceae bacterium]
MTARQQRRLEQKVARKTEKKASKAEFSAAVAEPRVGAGEVTEVPISEARLAANRANAQLSSGPVTDSGKHIVSQNATRHGLTGKFQVLPGESQADFDQMLAGFMRAEAPADQEEVEFVQQMAQSMWLSSRSTRLQDQCCITIQSGTPEEQKQAKKDLSLYLRYMTTHERAFIRFSTELRKRRNERRKAERGFVSQKHREANENRKAEMHVLRQSIETCKQEHREIQNRIAAAKAERLELQNTAKKASSTMAAAA